MNFNQIAVSLDMDQETALKVAKDYIDEGKITSFDQIFHYVEKTTLHKLTGINYYKVLRIAKNPKTINFEDVYSLGHALKVQPEQIASLILKQLGTTKTSKKSAKGR